MWTCCRPLDLELGLCYAGLSILRLASVVRGSRSCAMTCCGPLDPLQASARGASSSLLLVASCAFSLGAPAALQCAWPPLQCVSPAITPTCMRLSYAHAHAPARTRFAHAQPAHIRLTHTHARARMPHPRSPLMMCASYARLSHAYRSFDGAHSRPPTRTRLAHRSLPLRTRDLAHWLLTCVLHLPPLCAQACWRMAFLWGAAPWRAA